MRLSQFRRTVRRYLWLGIGAAGVLGLTTAGVCDPPESDVSRLQREIDEKVIDLRKETDALRVRLEKVEAELKRLEAAKSRLVRAEWKERVKQRYEDDLRRANSKEEPAGLPEPPPVFRHPRYLRAIPGTSER